ncbi:DEAD/DEAH box helicase [Vibrio salinus]|uniref:DEAD/DEAH box helicase n=1 Tax=Vibrio salinus TaxID=2899784 RepID=UPI001E6583E0|nr:DEAD/DEAH box helicase [Vibrio salinus]MCE0492622.1 DEAD/DEAH box helicase [Vibrio salinus]
MYILRPYQSDAVKAVIHFFRHSSKPAVVVLPTGAGKSLVIAELARLAKGRVLVLAHVKELVEQNHAKYEGYGLSASIFSAGLGRKETEEQVIFASIQSVANNLEQFKNQFSLLIIDECHRVPENKETRYQKVIQHLVDINPGIKILGLTATPYRLGIGWIYQYHSKGIVRSEDPRFFYECIYELPIQYLLDDHFLTPANIIDAPVLSYDFSQISPSRTGVYKESELNLVISKNDRATPQIVKQISETATNRQGVMIFAATVRHAEEIYQLLPDEVSAIITGSTPVTERDLIIDSFKNKDIKFLVNVSVLTTGFDAPHVDLIAILRPTASVSLYQQIVGRGLRLSPGKKDCLVLDYAGNQYDLFQPEMSEPKPDSDCELITVPCPACGFNNSFWGKVDSNGYLLEHFGRKCQGFFTDEETGEKEHCNYRFRAKYCRECGAENDIAARVCHLCDATLVDPDKKLKEALNLKDSLVFECVDMHFSTTKTERGANQLKVSYESNSGSMVSEYWNLRTKTQKARFMQYFVQIHLADKHRPFSALSPGKVVDNQHRFRLPKYIIASRKGRFWTIRDKIFSDELNI